jgi:hypothetical protein
MRMRIAVCGRQLRELPCHGPCHLRRRFRISEFDSSSRAAVGCSTVSSQGAAADPPHATTVRFCALLKTGANMVSRTKERAREPLLVLPALPALVAQSTCWLRSAATARLQGSDVLAQHPCSSTAYMRATIPAAVFRAPEHCSQISNLPFSLRQANRTVPG